MTTTMTTTTIIENKQSIYRYKLDENVMERLTSFAKLHERDDRITYKEAWIIWYANNSDIFEDETNRLRNLGYIGSIEDKFYKSARYYFRKKDLINKKTNKKRRNYISIDSNILVAMDYHIERFKDESDYTPASGYDGFCKGNIELLKIEINKLCQLHVSISPVDFIYKIKKTYKNRYFLKTRTENAM